MQAAVAHAWQDLSAVLGRLDALVGARSLLEWDQLCMMPAKGAEGRGDQLAALSAVYHETLRAPSLLRVLDRLDEALESTDAAEHPIQRAAVRNLRRERDRAVRLPVNLVEAMERARTRGHQAWLAARRVDDFTVFVPALTELVGLAGEMAACLVEPGGHPYDVLMDAFEPGAQTSDVAALLERLASELAPLLDQLRGAGWPDCAPGVQVVMPLDRQRQLLRRTAIALGFDLEAGRFDTAVHPFTCGMDPGDVRITTRYNQDDLLKGLGATLHEVGHGLYEQGVPRALRGSGAGRILSTGLHESQSRFWENVIGASLPFCRWFAGHLAQQDPGLAVGADELFRARNRVQPGLIRVDADELTYNLHIVVRFRLEVGLMEGAVSPADLEEAWNAGYQELLGVSPPSAKQGVLQDVHWAEGLFGYFPTYTLGSLYAASLGRAMEAELPAMWEQVAAGDFAAVLGWLRSRVHARASLADGGSVLREATRGHDPVADFSDHLWRRHSAVHQLQRPGQAS